MLENIRKYTGLMAVVIILLFVGLVFLFDTTGTAGLSGGATIAKMDSYSFKQRDLDKASSAMQLMNRLRGPNNWTMQLLTDRYNDPVVEFMVNRQLIRSLAEEMGIYPSTESVGNFLRDSGYFSKGSEQSFDEAEFERFKSTTLGSYQLNHSEFIELIRDEIRFRQISSIITGDLAFDDAIKSRIADRQMQTIDLGFALINTQRYRDQVNPSEEEIQAYWEENKSKYLTEEQRQVHWVRIAIPEENKVAPLPEAEPLPEDADEEAKIAHREARKTLEAEHAEATQKLNDLLFQVGEGILDEVIQEREGKDLLNVAQNAAKLLPDEAEAIEQTQITTGKTELFTRLERPEALAGKLFGLDATARLRTPIDHVFARRIDGDEVDKVSDFLLFDNASGILFKVVKTIPAEPLPFEEAKNSAKQDLINSLLDEKVTEVADQLVAKLKSEMNDKDDALKLIEAEGFEYQTVENLSARASNPDLPNSSSVFEAASFLNPGDVGEPIDQASTGPQSLAGIDQGKIVFVVLDRKIDASPNQDSMREMMINYFGNQEDMFAHQLLLAEWIRSKQDQAKVEIVANIR